MQKSRASVAEEHFYGPLTWVAVQRITLPVYIFFRSISSLLIHHWSTLLTSKTDFTRLCCSSIAGRDPIFLKMKSPALLNLSRIVMLTQSDEGVWRLYTWSRVLNTYYIEKTLRLREGINEEKNVFFRALPELPKPPPMTPIRATWSSFFGSRNSRFESQCRTKNTIYTI